MSACQVERDMIITDNPPKSPFLKGGLSQIPPFLKGDKGGL